MTRISHTQLINIGHGNAHFGNIRRSFITFSTPDESELVMHWISPLEMNNRPPRVCADLFDCEGDLLPESRDSLEWKVRKSGVDKTV